MKKTRLTAAFLSVLTAGLNTINVEAQEYCETLKYIICDEKAVITGYEGNPEVLEIPARIDGKEVVEIRENAFYKCNSLRKVTVPQTVTFIGHHAFFECTSLEEVILADDIYSIDEGCFSGCIALEKIRLPDNLRVIDDKSFFNCKNLNDINFPAELEEIGDYTFANCSALSEVFFHDELINIGEFSFFNCEKLGKVYIPDSVMSIGSCSFGYYGDIPKPLDTFRIIGNEESLGRIYAESNGMTFENTGNKKVPDKYSGIPALAVIASGAGLLFFQFLEKLKGFKRKYEYEY